MVESGYTPDKPIKMKKDNVKDRNSSARLR